MIPDAWAPLRGLDIRSSPDAGLINQTFVAGAPPRYAVQRVNPLFSPRVHDDIEAVTAHLAARGLVTPRLVRTDAGALWATDEDGGVWRVLTWVPGRTLNRITSPKNAAEAGALVARFHAAVADLEWEYRSVRPGAHDTLGHMRRLEASASSAAGDARAVADVILADWATWQGRLDLPEHHAHGDLKVSNLRFDDEGRGVCLLDLDTLARIPLDVELGDAWRSWCNPVGEDSAESVFDVAVFEASAAAYQGVRSIPAEEREALVAGVERIALELASRFCRDVFEDCYFGWDPNRFSSRAAHNLFRARGQWSLARSVRQRRGEAERCLLG